LIDNEDNNAMKKYITTGRKHEFGNLLPNTSLKHIISSCTDFEEELTMLQTMGQSMGVMIDRTPKCHCEIAGEGIEYSWALAKNHFHQILLEENRGKEKFLASVRECISRASVTKERVSKLKNNEVLLRFASCHHLPS
jgi:hypothetical protein